MAAFSQLFQECERQVFAIALSYMQNSDDAKDVYQEVFMRSYRGISDFQSRSKFSTWVHRITVNVCLSQLKLQNRRSDILLDDDPPHDHADRTVVARSSQREQGTDQHVIDSDALTHVHQLMALLSPQQRMVFTLRHFEGYKIREIAEMMKCSEGSVKRHLFTGTNRMRKHLKKYMR